MLIHLWGESYQIGLTSTSRGREGGMTVEPCFTPSYTLSKLALYLFYHIESRKAE